MLNIEWENVDCSNPTVDSRIRLYIGVLEHTLDVLGIQLDYEVLNSENVKPDRLHCPHKSVQL